MQGLAEKDKAPSYAPKLSSNIEDVAIRGLDQPASLTVEEIKIMCAATLLHFAPRMKIGDRSPSDRRNAL